MSPKVTLVVVAGSILSYRKILKVSPGAILEELMYGGKFTIFALFYFVFDGKSGGDLTEHFLRYNFGGLIHGGAYFQNFTVDIVHYLLSIFLLVI